MTLDELMLLPWTLQGPTYVPDPDGAYWELRIEELPEFFVAAAGPGELMEETPHALATYLQSYLERGQMPPLPNPGRQQWVYALNSAPVGTQARSNWPTTIKIDQRVPQPA